MGLLKGSDWKAMWLSTGEGPSQDFDPPTGDEYDDMRSALAPSPYARKTFQFNKPVRRARLYATARGLYEMYVNGTRSGGDCRSPAGRTTASAFSTRPTTSRGYSREARTSWALSWATAGTPGSSGSSPTAGAPTMALALSFSRS